MTQGMLTEELKMVRRFEKRSKLLADGLEEFMQRNRITHRDLANELGLGRGTIRKLLDEEHEMKMPIETIWRLFDMAGIRMVRNEQEDA